MEQKTEERCLVGVELRWRGVYRKVLVCFWALATGNMASSGYKCVLKPLIFI